MAWLVVDENDKYLIFENKPAKTAIGWVGETSKDIGIEIKESNLATRFMYMNYEDEPAEI